MSLLGVVLVLIVVGVLLWLVNTYIPMDAVIKKIINAVVVIAVILWLLKVFGAWDAISKVRVGEAWFGQPVYFKVENGDAGTVCVATDVELGVREDGVVIWREVKHGELAEVKP